MLKAKLGLFGRSVLAAATIASAGISAAQDLNVPFLKRFASESSANFAATQRETQALAARLGLKMKGTFADGRQWRLDHFENGLPVYRGAFSLAQAQTLHVTSIWPGGSTGYGLTGAGQTMGIWDVGVPDASHRELVGRVSNIDSGVADHPTHVSGIMGATGLNLSARGMAYQAKIRAYDDSNDAAEAANEAASGLQVSNHSYGFYIGWQFGFRGDTLWAWLGDIRISTFKDYQYGRYDSETANWDQLCYNAPYYLPVYAAGNARNPANGNGLDSAILHWIFDATQGQWTQVTAARDPQKDYDTISHGAVLAKNVVSVGAISSVNGGISGPSDIRLASFSSTGPSDDGRVKPDVCGVGVNVLSTLPSNQYGNEDGTSMAAPNVTGIIALLNQFYAQAHPGTKMRSSTVRGLLIHTAQSVKQAGGPDYQYGWGSVDAAAAAKIINDSTFNPQVIQELTLKQGKAQSFDVVVPANTPILKATICWTDPAGTIQGGVNDDRTPRLVNDLDLRITSKDDGTVYFPYVLDPKNPSTAAVKGDNKVDNVEVVELKNPAPGTYTITISNKGTISPNGSQIVSLITSAPSAQGVSGFVIDPGTVIGGAAAPGTPSAIGTITLTKAQATDTTFTVTSNNPSAAKIKDVSGNYLTTASVVVPANATSTLVQIQTYSIVPSAGQTQVPVTIIATSPLGSRSVVLNVKPIGIASISLDSSTIVGGNFVNGTVTLGAAAPKNGAAIILRSDQPSTARSTRNWVLIPPGQTTASFRVKSSAVSDSQDVVLTGDRLGTTADTTLTVTPNSLSTITSPVSSLTSGQTAKITLTLDGPATSSGATITLASSDSSLLSVPASITIASGQRTYSFSATAGAITKSGQVTITASRLGVSKTLTFTVAP